MNTALPQIDGLKELDRRENDGIAVSLLWNARTNHVHVVVEDAKSGETFALAASPGEALDVFKHPFAYAATRPSTLLVSA